MMKKWIVVFALILNTYMCASVGRYGDDSSLSSSSSSEDENDDSELLSNISASGLRPIDFLRKILRSYKFCIQKCGARVFLEDGFMQKRYIQTCVKSLGVDINKPDDDGCILLHYVTERCPMRYLLCYGSYVNHQNNCGMTPLLVAAKDGNTLLMSYIFYFDQKYECVDCSEGDCKHVVDINVQDNNGYTLLHWVVDKASPCHVNFNEGDIKKILDCYWSHINFDLRDKSGRTIFDMVADDPAVLSLFNKYAQRNRRFGWIKAVAASETIKDGEERRKKNAKKSIES